MRFAVHRELGVFREPVLPIHRFDALEQLFKRGGFELGHLDLYAVGTAQPDVGAGDRRRIALEFDAAVFGHDVGVAEVFHFAGHDRFESHRSGGNQCKF